jgi:hypothetical protein
MHANIRRSLTSVGLCLSFVGIPLAFLHAAANTAAAQCQPQWRGGDQQGFPGANSTVQAMGLGDPDGAGPLPTCLIVGGNFTFIGDARTTSIAYWNPNAASGSGWTAMARTDQSSGTNIYAFANWSNRIIVGGGINGINPPGTPGTQPVGIGAWDGSKWVPLSANQAVSTAQSLAVVPSGGGPGTLFAMSRDPSPPSTRALYRYVPGATLETGSWTPLLPDVTGTANQLVTFNDAVYIIGSFWRTATPNVRFQVARFDPNTSDVVPLPTLGGNSGVARGAIVYQNELYVFGNFTTATGAPANRIVKLNAAGDAFLPTTADPSISIINGISSSITSAAVFNNQLWIGTDSFNRSLARLSAANGVWSGPAVTTQQSVTINAMIASPDGTRLAMGGNGSFNFTGSSANRFAFYNPADNTFAPAARGLGERGLGYPFVNAAAEFNGQLYIGGDFAGVGAGEGNFLARWDGTTLSHVPNPFTGGVDRMFAIGNALYISASSRGLTRFDGTTFTTLTDSAGGTYASGVFNVNAAANYQGDLVVGHSTTGSSGRPSFLMRRTATNSWSDFGGVNPNNTVTALTTWSNPNVAGGAPLVIATGSFTQVGSLQARVAAWDGTSWLALGQPNFAVGYTASPAVSLFVHNNDLHMAAYITNFNGQSLFPMILRYNPLTDRWDPFPPVPNTVATGFGQPTRAISAFGSIWVITSTFNLPGTGSNVGLLRWDGTAWSNFGAVTGLFPQVNALATYQNDIVITGLFGVVGSQVPPPNQGSVAIGGVPSVGWARLNIGGQAPTITANPGNDTTCPNGGGSFAVQANSNNPPLGYQWQWREAGTTDFTAVVNGSNPRFTAAGAAAATLVITNASRGTALEFRARVFDSCFALGTGPTSNIGTLSICIADFNCNGSVDFFDYLDFVQAFADELPSADVNQNGSVDFFDYLDYVQAFADGC